MPFRSVPVQRKICCAVAAIALEIGDPKHFFETGDAVPHFFEAGLSQGQHAVLRRLFLDFILPYVAHNHLSHDIINRHHLKKSGPALVAVGAFITTDGAEYF
mgnify:CR=1 FL=1